MDAIDDAASARGMLRSGRRLKELTEFGQGLAAEEFGAEFNRLSQLAGIGTTATALSSGLASDTAANLGMIALSQGRDLSNVATQRANEATALYSNIGGALQPLFGSSASSPAAPTKKPSRLAPIVVNAPTFGPLPGSRQTNTGLGNFLKTR